MQSKELNLSIDHQQQLNATLYIPQNASAENKVPLVITSSGWEDAGESWSYVATELSRRGIAVANMEPYSHGTSGMFYQKGEMALYTNMYSDGMGMVALTDYLTSGILDFIDTDKVGVTGLSMGGICTWTTVQHYGHMYNAAIEQAQSPDSDGGESITEDELLAAQSLLKVTAALPCGSPPTANNGYDRSICGFSALCGFPCCTLLSVKNIGSSRFHKNVPAETADKCLGGTDGCCSVLFRSNIRTAPFPPPFSGSAKLHRPVHADPDFHPEAVQSFCRVPASAARRPAGLK